MTTTKDKLRQVFEALERAKTGLEHATVFISSREKMHPNGIWCHKNDITHVNAALALKDDLMTSMGEPVIVSQPAGTWVNPNTSSANCAHDNQAEDCMVCNPSGEVADQPDEETVQRPEESSHD